MPGTGTTYFMKQRETHQKAADAAEKATAQIQELQPVAAKGETAVQKVAVANQALAILNKPALTPEDGELLVELVQDVV